MAARRTFTLEFKREAVRMVSERKLSISEAARQLGVGPNLIRKWRQALEVGEERALPEKKSMTAWEEENRRLRAENALSQSLSCRVTSPTKLSEPCSTS